MNPSQAFWTIMIHIPFRKKESSGSLRSKVRGASTSPSSSNHHGDSFTRLARQGDAIAQFNLAMMHMRGEGVMRDAAAAQHWFEESASHGNIHAQRQLSKMYFHGLGVPRCMETATYWTRKAADQGDPDSEILLSQLYALTAKDLRAEHFDSALAWLHRASEQKKPTAEHTLAGWYYTGFDGGRLARDPEKAFEIWRGAADRHAESRCHAGELMLLGEGVEQNVSTGLEWLRLAGEENPGNVAVLEHVKRIANEAMERAIVARDDMNDKRAMIWFEVASELGNVDATLAMADLHYESKEADGKGFLIAAEYYKKAGGLGSAYAFRRLGTMHLRGEGVLEDVVTAYDNYKLAAHLGDRVAKCAFQPPEISTTDSLFHFNTANELCPSPSVSATPSTTTTTKSKMLQKLARRSVKNKALFNAMTTSAVLTREEIFQRGQQARKEARYLEAIAWFKEAAAQETGIYPDQHVEAMMILGIMFGLGQGVDVDKHEAATWLTRAARRGHVAAKAILGSMYVNEGEYEMGYILLRQCVDQGNGEAAYMLGMNYWHGNGVKEDAKEAKRWLNIAIQLGYDKALQDLREIENQTEKSG
ncbi:hypothetical protein BC936DRAFT_136790 [Jimgerdemannia flammicorona]|uniref:Uncharacterized protein n=2 Tax=Jimgerdemannia flammicorona TaxID=994334 RepID=A0A433QHR3_9FUNG|nr:hypothetical protein BC936DRAFT_136790 [Jimgerdemannia flammicorona]RUS29346.1 hypothetical protein BC938DRAFT_480769 [Jimgerdemannia flammicorona]